MLGIVGGGGVVGVSSGSSKRTMVDDGQHGVEEWRQRADPRKAVATSPRGEAMVRSSSLKSEMYKPSFGGFVDVDLATNKLSLRSLIDHSVVESFGEGGKTNILSRVYPELAITHQAHLYVFNNDTEPITVETLSAWSMKSANIKSS